MTRAIQNPDLLRPISFQFPRMSFYIVGVSMNTETKLNTVGTISAQNQYSGTKTIQYNPVPFNFYMRLSIIGRNTEDCLQIVEQILPYFTPDWTTTLDLIPEMGEVKDIPIILKSLSTEDHYEGQFESKQFVTWDLDFLLKGYLYGPAIRTKIIKFANVNFFTPESTSGETFAGEFVETISANDISNATLQEHLYIQPGLDANGNPTTILANSVPLSNIYSNSNYGIIEKIVNDGGT